MAVAIHDKSPEGRKKLVEGPKAQEKYVEELQSEWIDNHATIDAARVEAETRAHEAQVPASVKARARMHERQIADRMGGVDGYDSGKEAIVEEFHDRVFHRDEHLHKTRIAILNADIAMFGHVREGWVARFNETDDRACPQWHVCDFCGEPATCVDADYFYHPVPAQSKACHGMIEAERVAAKDNLAAFLLTKGIES